MQNSSYKPNIKSAIEISEYEYLQMFERTWIMAKRVQFICGGKIEFACKHGTSDFVIELTKMTHTYTKIDVTHIRENCQDVQSS